MVKSSLTVCSIVFLESHSELDSSEFDWESQFSETTQTKDR